MPLISNHRGFRPFRSIFLYFYILFDVDRVTPEHRRDSLAATTLSSEIQVWEGVVIEAWLTFMLVITIHGSVNKRRKKDGLFMPTIPIGMAVTMGVICGVRTFIEILPSKYGAFNHCWFNVGSSS